MCCVLLCAVCCCVLYGDGWCVLLCALLFCHVLCSVLTCDVVWLCCVGAHHIPSTMVTPLLGFTKWLDMPSGDMSTIVHIAQHILGCCAKTSGCPGNLVWLCGRGAHHTQSTMVTPLLGFTKWLGMAWGDRCTLLHLTQHCPGCCAKTSGCPCILVWLCGVGALHTPSTMVTPLLGGTMWLGMPLGVMCTQEHMTHHKLGGSAMPSASIHHPHPIHSHHITTHPNPTKTNKDHPTHYTQPMQSQPNPDQPSTVHSNQTQPNPNP